MIGEAVDTLRALGWALAVWIVLLALTGALALHAVVVVVAWAPLAAREALSAALAASRALRALPEVRAALSAAHARTRPSWAQAEQEAA
ncbi:hypothetical protein [Streptomyces sp. NPDC001315]|uniref:hypothetical protein n=1 Tax=Streptomyces sp. NPDC001315 TaxID=3364562 RepID=UPI00369AF60C